MTTAALIGTNVSAARTSRKPKRDVVLIAVTAIIVLLLAVAILAPLLAPYSPDQVDLLALDQGLSPAHPLGTDALGRDVLSRLLFSARLSLLGAATVTILATLLGTSLALLGVWRGGLVDKVLARGLDILFAFPSILFAILAVVVFGPGLVAPVLALSVAYIPYIARVIRSAAMSERHLPYIESFQLLGFSAWRTAVMHLLRNLRLYVGAQATITFGYALLDLAAVSFIGLGVQPPSAEWGLMVADGTSALLNGHGQQSLSAGAAIVLTVVVVNVLGERLTARAERSR